MDLSCNGPDEYGINGYIAKKFPNDGTYTLLFVSLLSVGKKARSHEKAYLSNRVKFYE